MTTTKPEFVIFDDPKDHSPIVDLTKLIRIELYEASHNYHGFRIVVKNYRDVIAQFDNCEGSMIEELHYMFLDLGFEVLISDEQH